MGRQGQKQEQEKLRYGVTAVIAGVKFKVIFSDAESAFRVKQALNDCDCPVLISDSMVIEL